MTPDTTQMHFGIDSHPLLRALQIRVDELPNSSLNFVAALMAVRDLIPQPLCDLIFGMVAVRNGIEIGPVHQALAAAVAMRGSKPRFAAATRDAKLALISACGVSRPADVALRFVIDLPGLVHSRSHVLGPRPHHSDADRSTSTRQS
jgi:hypothetical protein